MKYLSILILAFASVAHAQVKSVDGNAQLTPTPRFYTVVACPDNFQSDPLSQSLLNSFASDPTMKELRQLTRVYTYKQSNPGWQEQWGNHPTPMIAVMDGDKILYKRTGADPKAIAGDIGKGKVLERIKQLFPQCDPNDPNCPRPPQPTPYNPYGPTPNPLTPVTPNNSYPSTPQRPVIPDTPVEPPVDYKAEIDALIVRIEVLEKQIKTVEGKAGKPGPKGDDGKDGAPGRDGKDGQHGKDAVVDLESLAASVALKLPPITFERLDQKGSVIDSVDVHLGKKAKFPPLTVHYLNGSGSILDTEFVPVGGTLNLHIDVLSK